MTPILIDHINEKGGGTPANIYQAEFPLELLHSMNMVPCGYHRYYYMKQAMLEHAIEEFNEGGTRAEQMKQVEHELFEIYKNAELHENQNNLENVEEHITVMQLANVSVQFMQIRRSIW